MATSAAVLNTILQMDWPFEIAQILESAMQNPEIYPHQNIQLTDQQRSTLFARVAALKAKRGKTLEEQAELTHIEDTVSRQFSVSDHEFLAILFHYDKSTSNRDLIGTMLYDLSRSYCGEAGQVFAEGSKDPNAKLKGTAQKVFVSFWTAYQCIHSFLSTVQNAKKLSSFPSDEAFASKIEATSTSLEAILLAAEPLFNEMSRFADETLKVALNKQGGKYSILPSNANYRPDLRIVDLVRIGKRQIEQLQAAFQDEELRHSLDSMSSRITPRVQTPLSDSALTKSPARVNEDIDLSGKRSLSLPL